MGIDKQWQATYSFRRFRDKTSDLSRIYWTQQLSADSLLQILKSKPPDEISVKCIEEASFDFKMHSQKVAETISWLPTYMERNRLHLLVIYTAFLETYLKDVAFFYTASLGHYTNESEKSTPIKLSPIGEAISRPILKSSTVPDMIDYASSYFDIDFGNNSKEWKKIYKIRCAAAHNGGIATLQFLQAISGMPLALNPRENEKIGLTWDELRLAMKYGDNIAALIDSKISNYQILLLETEQIMRELNLKKKLPNREKIWAHLANEYALNHIKRPEKIKFISKFYGYLQRKK